MSATTQPPPVASLLTVCKNVCDDLSTSLVQDVYIQIARDKAASTTKADDSYFSLADGVVQVSAQAERARAHALSLSLALSPSLFCSMRTHAPMIDQHILTNDAEQ